MFKFPLVIVYAIVAFNITAFTLLLQFNFLFFNSPIEKILAWIVTVAAWALTYVKRNTFYTIRFNK